MLNEIIDILDKASSEKPWMTARSISKKLGQKIDAIQIEDILLKHCEQHSGLMQNAKVRYSNLPSRKTLDVLWGSLQNVKVRDGKGITKKDVSDDSLLNYENHLKPANVFISHSHKDYYNVITLAKNLLENDETDNIIPWLAETHIQQGDHINQEIISSINDSEAFVLFLSLNSLSSRWTGKEYTTARIKQKPIFIVVDTDDQAMKQLIEFLRHGNSIIETDFLGAKGAAREFISEIIKDNELLKENKTIQLFAYSKSTNFNPTNKSLYPLKNINDLPKSISNTFQGS